VLLADFRDNQDLGGTRRLELVRPLVFRKLAFNVPALLSVSVLLSPDPRQVKVVGCPGIDSRHSPFTT
jgi:hypothetical protein